MNSDGRFKKVLFDEEMFKSNRSFAITKIKNNTKIIDSFISREKEDLIILTSIGRIFKFSLCNKYIPPTTKQSQGLTLIKLLPTEEVVSCCNSNEKDTIFLVSKKGKYLKIKNHEIYYAHEFKLGYLNEKSPLKNDFFIKILQGSQYLDIETNKNKSARLNFSKIDNDSDKKNIVELKFLDLEKDEHLENCYRLENFLN